jgi:alanine-glyoxylate aminotransferase-like protein
VNQITELKQEELRALRNQVRAEYEAFRARGLALDMTRGKPSPEQLDLANDLLALPGRGD